MTTVARDLYLSFRVLAALAAIFFVIGYGAPACRVCTFLFLNIRYDRLPFLSTEHLAFGEMLRKM
jgi:hypothetical protein